MNLMMCMAGEPEQIPFLAEIAALGAGIELGSYGLSGIRSIENWENRIAHHQAICARFQGDCAIHGPFIGMEFAHIDHLIREAVQRRLDMTFAAARKLGAKRVVLHSGFQAEYDLFKIQEPWLERVIPFWRGEILRWAGAGIGVVLENDIDRSPELLARLVNAVDHPMMGLCLDIGHLNLFSDLDGAGWVRRIGGRLHHVHLHDNDRSGDRHWRLGRGTIDFEPFFAALEEHTPQVTIALEVEDEMEVKLGNLRDLAKRFAERLD